MDSSVKKPYVSFNFTEEVQVKNPIMNLFVKGYLKKQQAKYIADLKEAIRPLINIF